MIKGSLKGVKKMLKQLDQVQADILEGQVNAVALSVLRLHEVAVQSIQTAHGGTSEIRYGPKRVVTVSKPGDPPNSDTGRLVQSIKFDFKRNGLVGRVGSNLKYAAWLEFGTLTMQPRPWLAPAVDATAKDVADIFKKAVNDAIKGAIK